MADQVMSPEMAATLHQRALERGDLAVWVISGYEPNHPGLLVARLITDAPTPSVLTAPTLPELRAKLPAGLARSDRQGSDPEDVLETWM